MRGARIRVPRSNFNFGLVVRPGPGSDWTTLGYQPRDNAEDYREMLRGKGVDVDEPHREEWEWPETAARCPYCRTPGWGEASGRADRAFGW